MIEIPVKKKHIANKRMYGYPRNHNGNSHKKTKRVGGRNYSDPYVREDHVLCLMPNMKKRMFHGSEARHIFERFA